jgi:hypothetical protein
MRFTAVAMTTAAVFTLAACASAPPSAPPLPTSVFFERADFSKVAGVFVAACSTVGGRVVTQTPNLVECAKPMGNNWRENVYRAVAVEQAGASNPDFHYQWTFVQSSDGIDVTVNSSEWIEHQNAFGKTTRDTVQGGDAAVILDKIRQAREKRQMAQQ